MRLYLVQHGEATAEEVNPDRPLTEKGQRDAVKTAVFLKASGEKIDVIWHSTKTRAIQTASIFKGQLSPKEGIVQKEGLAPNIPPNALFATIILTKKNTLIVGHLPFLQKLVSLVLLNSESHEIIRFNMAGVVCLERNAEGKWQLIFEIIPDLLV